jgi:hypothetical protein
MSLVGLFDAIINLGSWAIMVQSRPGTIFGRRLVLMEPLQPHHFVDWSQNRLGAERFENECIHLQELDCFPLRLKSLNC